MVTGTVLERDGAHYRVLTPEGERRAVLRKKVKREEFRVVVGDRVQLEPEAGGDLFGITAIEPRHAVLERRIPEGRGTRLVVANLDEVFVVTATADPPPLLQLLDRLLVLAEANEIAAAVVVNKIDIAPAAPLSARFRAAGYRVIETSVETGAGIAEFSGALRGLTAVVTGPSGAGKSSLLNRIEPGLVLRTGEVSEKLRRGKNTTVGAVMIPLSQGGFLVDTPGFSDVGLWGIEPAELASCFPEMRPFLGECRFQDCRHRTEPGCAVRGAVASGAVAADRLESYHVLLGELEQAPRDWE
jgi:ribosome biogenesis GTPase